MGRDFLNALFRASSTDLRVDPVLKEKENHTPVTEDFKPLHLHTGFRSFCLKFWFAMLSA